MALNFTERTQLKLSTSGIHGSAQTNESSSQSYGLECQKGQTKPITIMELNIDNRSAYLIYGAPVIHA